MNKAKVKLIIAALVFALLVGGGVYFVKDKAIVQTADKTVKQFSSEVPTEVAYAQGTGPVDNTYVQPTEIALESVYNSRVYSAFCDENFQGRYVILDRKYDFTTDNGEEYNIRTVGREEFKEFFEENIIIASPEGQNIFEEAEMTPLLITAYLTKSEGMERDDSPFFGQKQWIHVFFDSKDGNSLDPDVHGSEKYLSGIDVKFQNTSDYGKHFRENQLDIAFSDAEIVRLVESRDLLCGFSGDVDCNSFIAIVDAVVSCNENCGAYRDLEWVPEPGHQNKVRMMMTCCFDIRAMDNGEPITDHYNTMRSLGIYSYEPLD